MAFKWNSTWIDTLIVDGVEKNIMYANGTIVLDNSEPEPEYGWVSGGTSSEASSTPDDCVNSNDVGNVRLSSAGCEWVTYDGYQSQQDESTTVTCSEGATRVQCTYFTNFNQWSCSMQEGNEYEEYETCEVV